MPASDEARAAIAAARRQIDQLDLQIVRLLCARARHVLVIGNAKRLLEEPVYQPDRELEVFEHVLNANEGPLDDGAIRRLFERIIDEARRLERSAQDAHEVE